MPEARARAESASSLETWMRQRLAAELGVEPAALAADRPLAEHGVSSRMALGLLGDLERRLGRRLPDTLPWDHPTLHALAGALAGQQAPSRATPPPSGKVAAAGPLAVVGLACRFPGANGAAAFWSLLREGRDAVGPAPAQRRDSLSGTGTDRLDLPGELRSLPGGWLTDVDRFDAAFFGILPGEAADMDPQQRLLLEVARDALDDAGQPAAELAGRRVGVFVGISTGDYAQLQLAEPGRWSAHVATGSAASIAANRISYLLDLRGPSLAVDTACSSSLVAVHLACESLARGECELALAAGVNLVLSPALTVILARGGFLSPRGRCRAFDATADGYVRGEGCGVVVLAPLAAALERGDRVRAVVRGTAVAQDGRTNGLTAPSRPAQEDLLREACRRAGVEAPAVAYVEAHGSGTALGDTLELAALAEVFGRGRAAGAPCRVGSVKTNIGHLEAAAGIAGFIKAVLAVEHGEIPPSLHCPEPNPRIDFAAAGLEVARAGAAWPPGFATLAGVSSFGFGGTLAHAVLEAPPAAPPLPVDLPGELLLPLSARDDRALAELAGRYGERLAGASGEQAARICRAAARRRDHHPFRLALSGATAGELARALGAAATSASADTPSGATPPRLAFVFSGLGGEHPCMGRELFDCEPAFRRAFLEGCDLVGAAGGPDLPSRLLSGDPGWLDEPATLPAALFVLQAALVGLLRAWGIEPDAAGGHGAGELAAAWAAGALTLAEAAELAVLRGEALHEARGTGRATASFTAAAEREPQLPPRPTAMPLVSTLTGVVIDGVPLDAADWERRTLTPASCDDAVENLLALGVDVFLELGPRPALAGPLARALRQADPGRGQPRVWAALAAGRERQAILAAVGGLWAAGRPVDWSALVPGTVDAVDLPAYPWRRESHWLSPPAPERASARSAASLRLGPAASLAPDSFFWELELDGARLPGALDHRLHGTPVLPMSAFVELGRQAAAVALGRGAWVVADLVVERTLELPEGVPRSLQVVLRPEGGARASFQVFGREARDGRAGGWVEHGRGRLECVSV